MTPHTEVLPDFWILDYNDWTKKQSRFDHRSQWETAARPFCNDAQQLEHANDTGVLFNYKIHCNLLSQWFVPCASFLRAAAFRVCAPYYLGPETTRSDQPSFPAKRQYVGLNVELTTSHSTWITSMQQQFPFKLQNSRHEPQYSRGGPTLPRNQRILR